MMTESQRCTDVHQPGARTKSMANAQRGWGPEKSTQSRNATCSRKSFSTKSKLGTYEETKASTVNLLTQSNDHTKAESFIYIWDLCSHPFTCFITLRINGPEPEGFIGIMVPILSKINIEFDGGIPTSKYSSHPINQAQKITSWWILENRDERHP